MRTPLLALLWGLAACGGSGPPAAAPNWCDPPVLAHRAFRSRITPRLGDPHHAVNDVIVAVGEPFAIRAKFSYGKMLKDLEREPIGLVLGEGPCGPWDRAVEAKTDDDGWARFERPAFERAVVRPFQLTVLGDGSKLSGHVWAVAPGTPAVLFDIDGTLTTGDGELLEDLFGGSAPAMRAGASDVAKRWAELGYLVVYMTGRPYPLRRSTLRWLEERGFPLGPVLTPDEASDGIPTRARVGAFKRATLIALQEDGLVFEAAYGNAATDVCAYAEAGLPPDRTWILESRGPCDDHPAPHALTSYVDHLEALRDHPRAPE